MVEKTITDVPASTDSYIKPQQRLLHDPAVTFEEYVYYAQKSRTEEEASPARKPGSKGILSVVLRRGEKKSRGSSTENETQSPNREKNVSAIPDPNLESTLASTNLANQNERAHISDEEWANASRALRTATSGAAFYLITTDILGPFGVGFSLGTMGWGPGIVLFTVFGLMAGYSGYLIWKVFLGLDSLQFPLRNYGDLPFRIFGPLTRHCFNILQSIQLLFSVGLIIISSGQSLSAVAKFHLCYAVCCLIWTLVGFFLGQIRTLNKFGWLANAAVWINLLIMFISMGVIAHSPPNYSVAALGSAGSAVDPTTITPDPVTGEYPPVRHYNGLPNPDSLLGSINGLMQAVYAYGGLQLFVEFMAEMRRPRDFIKAMWGAQFFIWSVYLIYGSFVYYYQGQYAYQISYQGVSPYGWQTVGNILAIISAMIAAGLYGNIGIKVLYNNVFMDILSAPPLYTRKGKLFWAIIVPIYWAIAFIVAAAIPDFFGLVSVVAAFAMMQFTYSFPPLLAVGYAIKKNAAQDGEGFNPVTGRVTRHDRGVKRWVRGFFAGGSKQTAINIFNILYMLGALATAGLGAYAGIQGMINVFKNPQINAFTCTSPLNVG